MLHAARNWSKADVLCGEWPVGSESQIVVKDLKRRALWFRVLAGRALLRREWRALRVLENTEDVPRALARPDADSLVIEYVRGRSLQQLSLQQPENSVLPDETSESIENLVTQLHERGVTHGDLHRDNIMVDEDGNVALIDWATAHVFPQQRSALQEWQFREWRALDLRALAKIKLYHAPNRLTAQDVELLEGASGAYRVVKKLRRVGEKLRGKKREYQLESALQEWKAQHAEQNK